MQASAGTHTPSRTQNAKRDVPRRSSAYLAAPMPCTSDKVLFMGLPVCGCWLRRAVDLVGEFISPVTRSNDDPRRE